VPLQFTAVPLLREQSRIDQVLAGYGQGCVTLDGGDVFVAFTDSVSEAMNSADEEWDEEQRRM
jgi:hypothetical protein